MNTQDKSSHQAKIVNFLAGTILTGRRRFKLTPIPNHNRNYPLQEIICLLAGPAEMPLIDRDAHYAARDAATQDVFWFGDVSAIGE